MVKCNADQVRRLQRALKGEKNPTMRQRIQIVLLRESEMTQPEIFIPIGIEAQIEDAAGLVDGYHHPALGEKRAYLLFGV